MKIVKKEIREIVDSEDLRFFTVYLYVHYSDKQYAAMSEKYKSTKGAYVNKDRYITTSLQVIRENGWESDLGYIVPEPSENHLIRQTVEITARSIEIDYLVLQGSKFFDYIKVKNRFIEDNQVVLVDFPEDRSWSKEFEDELIRNSNYLLPLACSRKSMIVCGLKTDIENLMNSL